MVRVLTYIALIVTILAGSALLYRNQPYSIVLERAGEVHKDQEKVVHQGPPPVFGPVPNVMAPVPMSPVTVTPTAPEVVPTPAAPMPKPKAKPKKAKPKTKRTPAAESKLQSKWTEPTVAPSSFDRLGDLFNIKMKE